MCYLYSSLDRRVFNFIAIGLVRSIKEEPEKLHQALQSKKILNDKILWLIKEIGIINYMY